MMEQQESSKLLPRNRAARANRESLILRAVDVFVPLVLCLFALPGAAIGANYCVTPSGAGSKNGVDWANAYGGLPSVLQRGSIYYLAAGTYASKDITTAVSGTSLITIKKASTNDHVTNVGWTDAMGAPAIINGLGIEVSYVTIDGQYPYGIKIPVAEGGVGVYVQNWGAAVTGVTLQYLDIYGPYGDVPHNFSLDTRCIYTQNTGYRVSNFTVRYCNLHAVSTMYQLDQNVSATPNNIVFEYNHFHHNEGAGAAHQNLMYMEAPVNVTVRYNEFNNNAAVGIYPSKTGSGLEVYGNYSHDGDSFVWIYETGGHTGFKLYNNTVRNVYYPYRDANSLASGSATNNVFYNCGDSPDWHANMAHDYNWYSGSSAYGEAHGVAGGSANPFSAAPQIVSTVSATYPRNKGAALASTYIKDLYGNTRGSDGTWDMGAHEYAASGSSTNPVVSVSPASLDFGSIAVGTATNLAFTVTNVGGGTLVGTASVSGPFSIVSGGTYSLGSNQSQTVTVRFSPTIPGNFSQSVTFTGGGGTSASVDGSAWAVLTGLSFESVAGVITAPFVTNAGGYISQPSETGLSTGGRAVYTFTVTNAGDYTISAIVNAPDTGANSFFVNIDAQPSDPTMIWDILPFTTGFESRTVGWRGNGTFDNPQFAPKVFSLSAGSHQLIIIGREGGVQLGRITISVTGSAAVSPPSNLRVASIQ